ncbi:hypothetical protein Tsp_05665 [Trichinella spiralis]|uniref:hypothetical protein n=1 Tax=Trichinella spiralis TaxID=6334 RepID=UPI0001EFE533|nr:hypothetical protein Tsp_05665 [Trichinella spiralis]
MASEMFQANRIKCFIIIWMAIGSLICLVDFGIVLHKFRNSTILYDVIDNSEFSCDFIKDSDKIIQHLAVNIDIGYVRMGKIFISCAKDPNYDLLFVAAVGSIFLSLGNAMALFYQSVKKPTIPGADYHLKYHIP